MRFYLKTFTFDWNKLHLRPHSSRQLQYVVLTIAMLLLLTICGMVLLVLKYQFGEMGDNYADKDSELILQVTSWPSLAPSTIPTSTPSMIPYGNNHENGSSTSRPSIYMSKISTRLSLSSVPTSRPTVEPSEKIVITTTPTLYPSRSLSMNQISEVFDELKFFVLGDIPYNRKGNRSLKISYVTVY